MMMMIYMLCAFPGACRMIYLQEGIHSANYYSRGKVAFKLGESYIERFPGGVWWGGSIGLHFQSKSRLEQPRGQNGSGGCFGFIALSQKLYMLFGLPLCDLIWPYRLDF